MNRSQNYRIFNVKTIVYHLKYLIYHSTTAYFFDPPCNAVIVITVIFVIVKYVNSSKDKQKYSLNN